MTASVQAEAATAAASDETVADQRRLKFVLYSIAQLLVVNIASSQMQATQYWKGAVFAVMLNLACYAAYITYYRDWKLLRWLMVVVVAGFVELIADWWLVTRAGPVIDGQATGNLVYGVMPKIWESPAYMPLAWAGVLVQILALGVWFESRMGIAKATLLTAVIGGINIPAYEAIARFAQWWIYVNVPMAVKNAPWYIVVGEFLCSIPLVWIGLRAQRARPATLVGLGIIAGLGIFAAYWIAFQLVGHCGSSFAAQRLDWAHGCFVANSYR